MKLYIVWGIEYHVGRTILGIYDSFELAEKRWDLAEENPLEFNEVLVEEVELNEDL